MPENSVLGAPQLAERGSWGCTPSSVTAAALKAGGEEPGGGGREESPERLGNGEIYNSADLLIMAWEKKEESRALHDAADQPQDIMTCHRIAICCQCF